MQDVIRALRRAPGWGLGLASSAGGVYVAATRPDWVLGIFAAVLFIFTLYILRLEAYIAENDVSE